MQQLKPSIIKNRRFKKLLQLRKQGYFNEDAIKLRYLYHIYVGTFQQENQTYTHNQNVTLTQFFQKYLINQQYKKLLSQSKPGKFLNQQQIKTISEGSVQKTIISNQDLDIQQHNLIQIIQLMFLAGQDPTINYNQIDNNEQYDDTQIINQDKQQKYFDSQVVDEQNNFYTGIQDF